MLNYYSFRKFNDSVYLLTNDFGNYCFLDDADFSHLNQDVSLLQADKREELINKGFILGGSIQNFLSSFTYDYRNGKNYLFGATSLHIFVVTNMCNLNCVYCQANNGARLHEAMSFEIARKAVDIALEAPQKQLAFEFQGGEPLLNYPVIKAIIEYSESKKGDRQIQYSVVTNLTLITEEMIDFFRKYHVSISTSIDGDVVLHNKNRSFPDGAGSYQLVIEKLSRIREAGIEVGAIETTTRYSFGREIELVDTYLNLGFSSIFLRPLTPLGKAKIAWEEIGYTAEEFVSFYRKTADYIVRKNLDGVFLKESFASTILTKVMTGEAVNYMEMRSPCGASCGQMAYYADGNVYTCDEGRMLAEMGDKSFRLGDVFSSSYRELIQTATAGTVCRASVLESIPSCCDCVYQPYCGICPVVNIALYHDLMPKSPNHYRCVINKGILDYYFELILNDDKRTMDVIRKWVE